MKKRQEALYDIAIGEEVTDIKDRQEIINLEKQYAKNKRSDKCSWKY